jgi:hypothetical protein
MQRAGLITDLQREQRFKFDKLGVRLAYRPDFTYFDLNAARLIAEDCKGFTVRDFPLRAACFRYFFPQYELRIIKK